MSAPSGLDPSSPAPDAPAPSASPRAGQRAGQHVGRGLLRSTSAATLAQLVRVVAIMATHLALRRLVERADWGLWNWAETVFLILATVRDLGLPSHTVRRQPLPLGNLLAVQLVWGTALAALVFLAAPLLAQGFSTPRPEVVPILQALTLYLLLEGLASVPMVYYEAELKIERALRPELTRTAVYCAMTLILAVQGFGVWSFVLAQLAAQAVFAGFLWLQVGRSIPLHWARGETLSLLSSSVPLGGIWLLVFAVTYADSLILGSQFSDDVVGGYMFAYTYAFFVSRVLQQPVGRSLYPAFVAYRDHPQEQFRAYRLGTVLLLALEVPAALFVCLNAPAVTLFFGGQAYLKDVYLLQLLAFAPLVDPLGRFAGEYLIARHRDSTRILSLVLHLLALVVGGVFLCRAYGPIGMAWANFLPLGALVVGWTLVRLVGQDFFLLLRQLAEVYLVPLPLFALAGWVSGDHLVWRFVLAAVAGGLSLAWFWWRFGADFKALVQAPALPSAAVAQGASSTD